MFDSDWSLKVSRAPRKLKNRLKIRSHIFNKVLRNLTKSKIKLFFSLLDNRIFSEKFLSAKSYSGKWNHRLHVSKQNENVFLKSLNKINFDPFSLKIQQKLRKKFYLRNDRRTNFNHK